MHTVVTEMADRLRLLEQQKRDEDARRQAGMEQEYDRLRMEEEERQREQELENERIYQEELRR